MAPRGDRLPQPFCPSQGSLECCRGLCSLGRSYGRRRQTCAVWSFSLEAAFVLSFIAWTTSGMLLLHSRLTAALILAYVSWAWFIDVAPTSGGRSPFLRPMIWWKRYCDYFPVTLVRTAPLPPDRDYIIGYHPHGIISIGAFGAFGTDGARVMDIGVDGEVTKMPDGRGFPALFPGIDRRLLTLPINFRVPFVREYLLSLGIISAGRASFQNWLKHADGPGHAVVVVVGGAEEAVETLPGEMRLVLDRRKGFVREAILSGASLVPCLAFGENELYSVTTFAQGHCVRRLQNFLKRITTVSVPAFNGRTVWCKLCGGLPVRNAVWVVVGAPLAPPPLPTEGRVFDPHSNPEDRAAVDLLHSKYVDAIKALHARFSDHPENPCFYEEVSGTSLLAQVFGEDEESSDMGIEAMYDAFEDTDDTGARSESESGGQLGLGGGPLRSALNIVQ